MLMERLSLSDVGRIVRAFGFEFSQDTVIEVRLFDRTRMSPLSLMMTSFSNFVAFTMTSNSRFLKTRSGTVHQFCQRLKTMVEYVRSSTDEYRFNKVDDGRSPILYAGRYRMTTMLATSKTATQTGQPTCRLWWRAAIEGHWSLHDEEVIRRNALHTWAWAGLRIICNVLEVCLRGKKNTW